MQDAHILRGIQEGIWEFCILVFHFFSSKTKRFSLFFKLNSGEKKEIISLFLSPNWKPFKNRTQELVTCKSKSLATWTCPYFSPESNRFSN